MGELTVWDATTGERRHTLPGHDTWVSSLAFSPDGRRLASLGRLGAVAVYDATPFGEARPHEPLVRFSAHTMSTRASMAFSPDGRRLVVPGDGNTVNIWNVSNDDRPSAPQLTLRGHTPPVWGVAISPDDRRIASGGEDNTVRLWMPRPGTRSAPGGAPHNGWVSRVEFSPDGKQFASASFDKTVNIRDLTGLHETATEEKARDTRASFPCDG